MSTHTKGFLGIAGIRRAAEWGVPVVVGIDNGIELLQDGISSEVQLLSDEQISGSCMERAGDRGAEFHRGDLSLQAKYETLALLWALAFGGVADPQRQGDTAAYQHTLRVDDLDGLFATLVLDYQVEVHEYTSVKLGGFSFECSQSDQVAKLTFPVIAHALNRNTADGVNRAATIPGITMSPVLHRLLFSQMTVRLGDADGPALGDADRQFVTGVTIEVDRKLKNDDVTTRYGTLIDEPSADGFTEVKGSLTFSKYAAENRARFTDMLLKTRKKLDVAFAGPPASGAVRYAQRFFLNDVQFESGRPNIGGPGLTPWTVNFKAHTVPASPVGFPAGYTDALQAEIVNTLATPALAA